MARSGMATLLLRLRSMVEAGSADYSVNGTSYWTDDQLQSALDMRGVTHIQLPLEPLSEYVAGAVEYHSYATALRHIEEQGSGTAVFAIRDAGGTVHGTSEWTANYDSGHFRFTADTDGSPMYLTTRAYDIAGAAADVWEQKAAHVSAWYDFSADGASFSRSQARKHYLEMAQFYRNQSQGARINSVRMVRFDANA